MRALTSNSPVTTIIKSGLRIATRDPGNDFLWKFNRRRLDAEAIRDSLLMISGQLDYSKWGPHPFRGPREHLGLLRNTAPSRLFNG